MLRSQTFRAALGAALGLLLAAAAGAADAGKATGTFTVDGTSTTLAVAVHTSVENLFDDKKRDTLIVLSDKPLGDTAPDDEIGISMRARTGDITVLALRIDGAKLTNVKVSHKGLSGWQMLPGAWFQYTASRPGTGSLKLAKREVEGRSYATSVEFAATPYVAPKPDPAPAPRPAPAPAPRQTAAPPPAPAPAVTPPSSQALVDVFVSAIQMGKETEAMNAIRAGMNPNGRDPYGIPVLNWAIMMCKPALVKELVDRKADLKYERSPTLTPLMEASACPDAAKILRAAGAK